MRQIENCKVVRLFNKDCRPSKSPDIGDQMRGYPLFQSKGTASYNIPANRYVDLVRFGRTRPELLLARGLRHLSSVV